MLGRITYMELRTGLKWLLIFGLLVTIVSVGMPMIYPTFRDSLTEELEGANKVNLELPSEEGDMIALSWEPLENAISYMVLEDNRSSMVTAKIKYIGVETSITFEKDFEEKRYYAVTAETAETADPVLIGIAGGDSQHAFQYAPFIKDELLNMGILAVDFAPQGRSVSEGEDNYHGFIHQDDLKAVIDFLSVQEFVDKENIGIITFSFGLFLVIDCSNSSNDLIESEHSVCTFFHFSVSTSIILFNFCASKSR